MVDAVSVVVSPVNSSTAVTTNTEEFTGEFGTVTASSIDFD